MIAATQDDLLQGLLIGGGFLLFLLLVWIVLHHANPEVKIEIGIRGWVNLTNRAEQDQEPKAQREHGDADGDDGPDARAVDSPDH